MHDASNSWHWDPKAMTWVADTNNGPITTRQLGDSHYLTLEHWQLAEDFWTVVEKRLAEVNAR